MTVSSNQPQDGPIPAPQHAGGSRVDAPHSAAPLPPTLFALPNLRAETAKVPTAQNPDPNLPLDDSKPFAAPIAPCDTQPISQTQPAPQEQPTPLPAAIPQVETASLEPRMIRHDQPALPDATSPIHDGVDRTYDIADPATFIDTPVETSLLDRIGSHAIVLVMLLIVFGIALLAGRKPIIESTTPVATQADDTTTPEAISTGNALETNSGVVAAEVATAPSVYVASDSINEPAAVSQMIDHANGEPNASETSATPPPSPGISASTVSSRSGTVSDNNSAAADSALSGTPKGQFSELLPSQVSPNGSVSSVNPLDSAETTNPSETAPNRYRYSKTPQKIVDWSRYLDALESSYVTPATATTTQPE